MRKFTTFSSRVLPMPVDNVDTDQIIPARFLKTISKEGLDKQLFYDWRYDAEGNPKPDFLLNKPEAKRCRDPVGGRQLRLRELAGTCSVGADSVWISGRCQHVVCGYLQGQRIEEFLAADCCAQRDSRGTIPCRRS